MMQKKEQPVFNLSRDFHDRAEQADRVSYRQLHLKITYHAPGFPHLLETGRHCIYDRVETGLDDLIVTRAIFENPHMALHFLPYLGDHPAAQPGKSDLEELKGRARAIFTLLSAPAVTRDGELKYLIERSNAELDLRLEYLKDMTSRFTVDFSGRHDMDNIARLETLPETKFLPVLKQYFANWMYRPVKNIINPADAEKAYQEQAPLNAVAIALEMLVEKESELQKARLAVDDCVNRGRRVVAPGWMPDLVLR